MTKIYAITKNKTRQTKAVKLTNSVYEVSSQLASPSIISLYAQPRASNFS